MRTAVTINTPASAVIGISAMTGARSKAAASRASEWMIETRRVCPPDLMPTERAGDGGRGGDAAKEGDDDVADALRHQFLVGLQADAGHLRGDGAAQQRLDRAEGGDREGRRNQVAHVAPGNGVQGQALVEQDRARDGADGRRRASR